MATTFDAIGADPAGAPGDDLRRPAGAADRDRHPARAAAVPRRVRRAPAAPAARRPGPADLAADPQRRDPRRHAGARPQRRRQPAASGASSASSDLLVEQPTTKSSLKRLEDLFDERQAARQARRSGADGLQLLELLLDAAARAPDRARLDRLLAARLADRDPAGEPVDQRSTSGVIPDLDGPARSRPSRPAPRRSRCPGEVETGLSTAGYSGLQANGKAGAASPIRASSSRTSCRSCTPTRPRRPARTAPTASPARPATCRASCSRPARAKSNPPFVVPDIPGDRGVTDVYFNQDGTRELRDTRVAARQP